VEVRRHHHDAPILALIIIIIIIRPIVSSSRSSSRLMQAGSWLDAGPEVPWAAWAVPVMRWRMRSSRVGNWNQTLCCASVTLRTVLLSALRYVTLRHARHKGSWPLVIRALFITYSRCHGLEVLHSRSKLFT